MIFKDLKISFNIKYWGVLVKFSENKFGRSCWRGRQQRQK
jgi:hypothetical protein